MPEEATIRRAYEIYHLRHGKDCHREKSWPQRTDEMTQSEYNRLRADWLSEALGIRVVIL